MRWYQPGEQVEVYTKNGYFVGVVKEHDPKFGISIIAQEHASAEAFMRFAAPTPLKEEMLLTFDNSEVWIESP